MTQTKTREFDRPNVKKLAGYVPGKQITSKQVIKLNANENPFPPAQHVRDALAAFDTRQLRLYPHAMSDQFRSVAARVHHVNMDNVMAVNGGDELLRLAITTFVEPGQPIGVTKPCYALYKVLATIHDSPLIEIPIWPHGRLPDDAAKTFNQAGVRLVFLTNPNAPLGTLTTADEIAAFARQLNGVLLVDEAYVDFVNPALKHDLTHLVNSVDNLVLLRSLSKGYSLAGIRFGYAIGSANLIAPMSSKTRDSYNVDSLAQTAAVAALEARDETAKNWAIIRSERERVAAALTQLGIETLSSETNFLLLRPGKGSESAVALLKFLESRGILIRYFNEEPIAEWLRITIGTPEDNTRLLEEITAYHKTH